MTFDQWMNVSGVAGMFLYLAAHWWRLRHLDTPQGLAIFNRLFRALGLTMLLIPLFFRWYLSAGMTLMFSLILLVGAGVMVLHHRKKGMM